MAITNYDSSRYGFIREVHQKYKVSAIYERIVYVVYVNDVQRLHFVIYLIYQKHNADRLLKLIDEVYRWLPLGTIVNNRVLVVHGGISDSTDLDLIKSMDRSKVGHLLQFTL